MRSGDALSGKDRHGAAARGKGGRGPVRIEPDVRQATAARRPLLLIGALIALMLAGGTITALVGASSSGTVSQQRLTRASATKAAATSQPLVSASNVALMGLVHRHGPAPNFQLVGQSGTPESLASLDAHRAVVLTFIDDRCPDVCPIVGRELARADALLGKEAARVAFVAVDVNAAQSSVGALRQFVRAHPATFGKLTHFAFLTGAPSALREVWSAYHIRVLVEPNGTVLHTEAMDFIAPGGKLRARATPYANERHNGTAWLPRAMVAQWGRGIAQETNGILK